MPTVHETTFSSGYRRYLGPLGSELNAKVGMNPSTHVAQVCLNPDTPNTPERAVVKHFFFSEKGWVNEYACWLFAHALGVNVAPRAALLVGTKSDILPDHGPELNSAMQAAGVPMVLWCTSAIAPTQPLQQVYGLSWEQAVLRTPHGRRLAALDGWIGNCDRIEGNALFWSTAGQLVAIDHEKMVFNQDWTLRPPVHRDEADPSLNGGLRVVATTLLERLSVARRSADRAVQRTARSAANEIFEHSRTEHPRALATHRASIEAKATSNFSAQAASNLLSFLDARVDEAAQRRRLGLTI